MIAAALAGGTRATLQDAQNFGNTPDLDAFCRAEGLSYHRAWIARTGVFEAGLEHWHPGLERPVEEAADEGGDTTMTLAELRRYLGAGRTLADVIARLSRAHVHAVPALTPASGAGGSGGA